MSYLFTKTNLNFAVDFAARCTNTFMSEHLLRENLVWNWNRSTPWFAIHLRMRLLCAHIRRAPPPSHCFFLGLTKNVDTKSRNLLLQLIKQCPLNSNFHPFFHPSKISILKIRFIWLVVSTTGIQNKVYVTFAIPWILKNLLQYLYVSLGIFALEQTFTNWQMNYGRKWKGMYFWEDHLNMKVPELFTMEHVEIFSHFWLPNL